MLVAPRFWTEVLEVNAVAGVASFSMCPFLYRRISFVTWQFNF